MIAFTFTGPGARRPFLGVHWPPPGEWAQHGRGSRIDHLPVWIAAELWLVELDGSVHEVESQLRAERGRLIRRPAVVSIPVVPWPPTSAGPRTQPFANSQTATPLPVTTLNEWRMKWSIIATSDAAR